MHNKHNESCSSRIAVLSCFADRMSSSIFRKQPQIDLARSISGEVACTRVSHRRFARSAAHRSFAGKGDVIFRVRAKLTRGMNSATPSIVKRRGVAFARKSEASAGATRALASDNRALVEYQRAEFRKSARRSGRQFTSRYRSDKRCFFFLNLAPRLHGRRRYENLLQRAGVFF